ncbi:MAG: ATP-dependent helicase/nuclease subunit [Aliidongia sp.]|nr:ATP-dependent helicase/nuclease subunit [Aliidongia sp.]
MAGLRELDPGAPQRRAADSAASIWVAASAGTGKTKVLTDRVLNLLLSGTAPGRILCLTFTKAAAAEMANRLNARLAKWAILPDMELRGEIKDITGDFPTPEQYARATQLFARVLDTPGGMRILTIHAFCQSVLRRFPLEAGIPPHFEVMDERSAAELRQDARNRILEQARAAPGGAAARALAEILAHTREQGFAELMAALTAERGRLATLFDKAGGLEPYLARLSRLLGVEPDEDRAGVLADFSAEVRFDGPALRRAAGLLIASKSVTDRDRGNALAAWLAAAPEIRTERWDLYRSQFLTQKLTPRVTLATKAVMAAGAWVETCLAEEQARVLALQQHLAALVVRDASAALARLGHGFLAEYEKTKGQRALLDYDDLILATRDLLDQPGVAPWVLFKLDGGIDHILIDEAQDTNPEQWQVVAALAQDFFTGLGSRDGVRTVFAVGDVKQSIFSFQRADPQEFRRMREHFGAQILAADQKWDAVPLEISFRSTAPVLDVVDAVFAQDAARDGVALDGAEIRHHPWRRGHAGRVELWPLVAPDPAADGERWAPPVVQHSESAPRARLAQMIAHTVAGWIDSGAELECRGRPIRAGDVLVLVRRRGGFVAELLRELKRLKVPVAGTDRMVLTSQLAVMDLMALGRFLLLPDDDLTFATVLKGPLIGLDEDQLFALAHGRRTSLWQALREHTASWAMAARATLSALLARADFVPPHELYAELLGAGRGRERLIGRLGDESVDAIDEFINQSLAYERAHVPSLQGFLQWLDSGEAEIKRDLDAGGDQLRIMTVHGAKGLQAPIVFLPDTIAVPTRLPPLAWPEDGSAMLWAPGEGAGEPVAAAARSAAQRKRDQEYRRLLYVALTRAEDRLYICGWQTRASQSDGSWYTLIRDGMKDLGRMEPIVFPPDCVGFAEAGRVYETGQEAPVKPELGAAVPLGGGIELPRWALQPPSPEPAPPRPLVASRPSQPEPPARSPLADDTDKRRFQRGTLVHRLLQSLPDLPHDLTESAARRYLAGKTHGLDPEEQDQIARETLAILRHPDFAPLFGPGSRAEVPVVGLIDGKALSGRIDRLVVTADEVMIIDYKTNRPPPATAAEVAPVYLEQLSAYRAALERIYPGKRVRTVLLWTDGARLMEVSAR